MLFQHIKIVSGVLRFFSVLNGVKESIKYFIPGVESRPNTGKLRGFKNVGICFYYVFCFGTCNWLALIDFVLCMGKSRNDLSSRRPLVRIDYVESRFQTIAILNTIYQLCLIQTYTFCMIKVLHISYNELVSP